MLSLFSKSFKTSERDGKGSLGTDCRPPVTTTLLPGQETRSCVSVAANNHLKKERRFLKGKHFRGLFSSDCEEEITSVVSDNPQLYQRTLGTATETRKTRKHKSKSKKTFDAVERKMNHIQASLSTMDLTNPPDYGLTHDSAVENLRKNLEAKEIFTHKLQEHLDSIKCKEVDGIADMKDLPDVLARKRRQIKKKKDQLKRVQDDGNIDVKISLAEMEYSLEKDQIEMMNLSQKMAAARAESVKVRAVKEKAGQESLYKRVDQSQTSLLLADRLDRAQLASVSLRQEGFGLELGEEVPGNKLQVGDRIIEINGENVVKILGPAWQVMMDQLTFPARVVVVRVVQDQAQGLKDDIALIQSRLSEKLEESRHVSLTLSAVQQQRDKLVTDNTRLRHRIQYLEDQVTHLEGGMKQVRDSLAQTLNKKLVPGDEVDDHVANVMVAGGDSACSSSTSGVWSGDASDGSNSPQYNSWRSGHVARLVIGESGRQWRRYGSGKVEGNMFVSKSSSQV